MYAYFNTTLNQLNHHKRLDLSKIFVLYYYIFLKYLYLSKYLWIFKQKSNQIVVKTNSSTTLFHLRQPPPQKSAYLQTCNRRLASLVVDVAGTLTINAFCLSWRREGAYKLLQMQTIGRRSTARPFLLVPTVSTPVAPITANKWLTVAWGVKYGVRVSILCVNALIHESHQFVESWCEIDK